MKVIFATDPIFWPLTGIGRYTLELARRFSSASRVTDVRFFNMGHWQSETDILRFGTKGSGEPAAAARKLNAFGLLRKTLSNNSLVVGAYSRLTPYVYRRRLNRFAGDYVYHGPNFMLPPFDGKKVTTFHDLSVLKYPEFHPESRVSFLTPEINKAAQNADHIITVSEAVRLEVIDYFGLPEDTVTAVHLASSLRQEPPNPASLAQFLAKHGLTDQQFLLFVSSIEPRKNVMRILDAYESLPSEFRKQHPLVLTGSSGWRSEKILDRISSLEAQGVVRYLGYTNDAELNCLYYSAGALVFPSIYEGFGLPIIESQSVGVPVLTSNVSCMPEVAGGAALLVDPFDVDEIAAGLEEIMLDEGLRGELRAKGFENAQKLSWDTTAAKTLDVYSRI